MEIGWLYCSKQILDLHDFNLVQQIISFLVGASEQLPLLLWSSHRAKDLAGILGNLWKQVENSWEMLKKPLKRQATIVIEHKNLAETKRLEEDAKREKNWKRWGPYLSERQWGTVREDYSFDGAW